MLATACGPGKPAIPADTLVIGQVAEPKSLDPHVATSTNDFRICVNIYEGLVRFADGSLDIVPALASDWSISDDGRTYTFHLRRGVVFHDGTPFDAEAVAWNFRRMLDEDHPAHGTGPFPLAFFFSAIDRIETPDTHTVILRLEEPFAPLLANLAYPTGLIVSPTAVNRQGSAFGRNPVGTGPFRFAEWESRRLVRLERHDAYWGDPAASKTLIFRPLTDENARLTELLAGGVDITLEAPPDIVGYFRERPGYRVVEQAGPHLWFLILNLQEGLFTDRRVRRAVSHAINRKTLTDDLLQGTATVARGPVPAAFDWAYAGDLEGYGYDPDKARQLLEAAGAVGEEVTFFVTEGGSGMLEPLPMATAIQADLAAIGLDVSIEVYEWNTYLAKVNAGLGDEADMAQMAWMTNDPDTLPYLALRTGAWPDKGGFNSGYYSNPEVDRLLEQARRTPDQTERARLYREVQRIVVEDAPWVFIASWRQNAVASESVRDFTLQPSFLLHLEDVYKTRPTS
ncbi:MAG: ABC transporter substrate-binding protein [Opitutales bacterium]